MTARERAIAGIAEALDAPKCPHCGHWMRWSMRLNLWLCAWCRTKLSTKDRSVSFQDRTREVVDPAKEPEQDDG